MELNRRQILQAAAVLGGVAVTGAGCSSTSGWPSSSLWDELREKVGGRLIRPTSPLAACFADAESAACTDAMARMQNPFYLEDEAGATQTKGWLKAWATAVTPYAVAATSASDVAAAVEFARENDVKLVIKGTGHDYLGRSSAPDSLLVWTHNMRDVDYSDNFVVDGGTGPGVPALTVQAGARWLEAYAAATEVGRYVQGGGCTSVGASGGFLQGSGYGGFSKRFRTGAGNVLQFEVVTAEGSVQVANAVQNPDLFWALRGGGAATWGVIIKTTLLAHPMPHVRGLLSGTIEATTTTAYRDLLEQLCRFIPRLINPSWGEQITFGGSQRGRAEHGVRRSERRAGPGGVGADDPVARRLR